MDNDFKTAFDFLVMTWVFDVLKAKGLSQDVIDRLQNLYHDNVTVVVVNNKMGRAFTNVRLSLRQGDLPSMFWFAYAIDPLLIYLEKRLTGLPIYKLPVSGPALRGEPPLPPPFVSPFSPSPLSNRHAPQFQTKSCGHYHMHYCKIEYCLK